MNLARFAITGSVGGLSPSTDRGYSFTPGETLTLTLEAGVGLVERATYFVSDANAPDYPLSSLDATAITLDNGTDNLTSVDAAPTPQSGVTVSGLPAVFVKAHSWLIRCVVDGGIDPRTGQPDPERVFERLVALPLPVGIRKLVPAEATQYSARSWTDAQNDEVDAYGATNIPPGTLAGQTLVWSGAAWIASALNLASAVAVTGVLAVANGGVPTPTNPGDDTKVLTASGGTYSWSAVSIGLAGLPQGAANTVLAGTGASPPAYTATPTVTSLIATSYLAAGTAPFAAAGELRLPASWSAKQKGGAADRAVLTGTGDSLTVGDAAQTGYSYLRGYGVQLVATSEYAIIDATNILFRSAAGTYGATFAAASGSWTFDVGCSAPTISQTTLGSGSAVALIVRAQASSNGAGGNLDLYAGSGTTTNGNVRLGYGATQTAQFGSSLSYAKVGANYLWSSDGTNLALYNGAGTQVAALYATASDYLRFGVTPSATGNVRVSYTDGWSLKARNSTNTADVNLLEFNTVVGNAMTLGFDSSTVLYIRAASVDVLCSGSKVMGFSTSGSTQFGQFFNFVETVPSPTIQQAARTDDNAPQNFGIIPQAPWASATGANRTPGSLVVSLAAPTNGGTTEGAFTVKRGGSTHAMIRAYDAAPTTYSGLWLGPGIGYASTNFALLSTGSSLWVNAPTAGGTVQILAGNTGIASFAATGIELNGAAATMIESVEIAAGRRVVALALGADLTTTEMPASTGDRVVFLANAATVPTAAAVGGNIIWSTSGIVSTAATFQVKGMSGISDSPYLRVENIAATARVKMQWDSGSSVGVVGTETNNDLALITNNAVRLSLSGSVLSFAEGSTTPKIQVAQRVGDNATATLLIYGQSASSTATGTNENAGSVALSTGAKDGAGLLGSISMGLNVGSVPMVEVVEVAASRKVVALLRGALLTATEMPAGTGDGVIYVGNATTARSTGTPVSGGMIEVVSGVGYWIDEAGVRNQI